MGQAQHYKGPPVWLIALVLKKMGEPKKRGKEFDRIWTNKL